MLLGNKEYRFIKDFVSPTLGNVYIGKIVHLSQAQGKKFIEAGLAEEHKAKKVIVENDGRGNTGASKKPSKGNAK